MGYLERNLRRGEDVVKAAKPHPVEAFKRPAAFAIMGSLAAAGSLVLRQPRAANLASTLLVLTLAATVVLVVGALVRMATTEYILTNRRVLVKAGLLSQRIVELNLAEAEGIAVSQGVLGRVANFGTVVVTGTGGLQVPLVGLSAPSDFRMALATAVEGERTRTVGHHGDTALAT